MNGCKSRSVLKKMMMMSFYQRLSSTMILALALAFTLSAQYDDIYFDADNASEAYAAIDDAKLVKNYSDDQASAYDDYDYYYSSRIKRFDSPYYGFDFYSPVYVSPYYYAGYGGFYDPYTNIYYSSTANRYSRWGTGVYVTSVNNVYGAPAYGGGTFVTTGVYSGYPGGVGFTGGGYSGIGYGSAGSGFVGSAAGGYNPYCPPAAYGGVSRPVVIGTPGNTGTAPSTRGNTVSNPGTYYGPRGTGTVNSSPRGNGNNGSSPVFEDSGNRPYVGQTNTGATRSDIARPTTLSPRTDRPTYTPPAGVTSTRGSSGLTRTRGTSDRFTSPARPTSSTYRPTATSTRSNRSIGTSTRSTYSPTSTRSSSIGSSRSASPRSSAGASRSSSGGRSPR